MSDGCDRSGYTAAWTIATSGLAYSGIVTAQEVGSEDSTFYVASLAGMTDDRFDTEYYCQVLKAGAVAPEPEVRQVSDYVSATGKFVVGAVYSADVEVGDIVLILHESLVAIGRNDANNVFDSSSVVANEDGSMLERLEWVQVALGGGAIQLRVEQSKSGPVEEGAYLAFAISLFDIDTGAVQVADIDITGISAVLEKSTGGAAFSSVGITQPTFAKANGLVSCDYRFLAAEWELGDTYKLTVSGITCTVAGDTAYVKDVIWSNLITEEVNIETKIDAIQADLGDMADAATADDLSDITTTSALAKIRRLLLRFSSNAFSSDIQGSARTDIETMMSALATYFSAAGAAWNVQTFNQTARTNLEQTLEDITLALGISGTDVWSNISNATPGDLDAVIQALCAQIGIDGANTFGPAMFGATPGTQEAAFAAIGTALGAEFDGTPNLYDVLATGLDSSGFTNNFDGAILEVIKAGLEKTTAGAFDPDTDSNEAIRNQLDTLIGTPVASVSTDLAAVQTDIGNPSARTNLQSLETMLGNPDTAGKTVYEAVKNIRETAIDVSSTPTANTLSDILHKDGSYTYDNTTDSLEALADAITALSADTWKPEDPQTGTTALTIQSTWYSLFTAYSSTTYVVKGAVNIEFPASQTYEVKLTYANAARDNGPVTTYVIGAADVQRTIEILPTEYINVEVRCTTAAAQTVTYDRCFEFNTNSGGAAPT